MSGLDSRRLCLPVEQSGFPNCSLVQGNETNKEYQDPEALIGILSRRTIPSWMACKSSLCNAGAYP